MNIGDEKSNLGDPESPMLERTERAKQELRYVSCSFIDGVGVLTFISLASCIRKRGSVICEGGHSVGMHSCIPILDLLYVVP
jgi:hypothetical protein